MSDSPAALSDAERAALNSDLAIFNYYNHPLAETLIAKRVQSGKPWCFWGERPGLRKPRVVGEWFRQWKLKALRRSQAPIWGDRKKHTSELQSRFGISYA